MILGRWGTTTSGCGALFRCYPAFLAEGPRPHLCAHIEMRTLQVHFLSWLLLGCTDLHVWRNLLLLAAHAHLALAYEHVLKSSS